MKFSELEVGKTYAYASSRKDAYLGAPFGVKPIIVMDTSTGWSEETRYMGSFGTFKNNKFSRVDNKRGVAIAWCRWSSEVWIPGVIPPSQILGTWEDHKVQLEVVEAKKAAQKKAAEARKIALAVQQDEIMSRLNALGINISSYKFDSTGSVSLTAEQIRNLLYRAEKGREAVA